MSSHWSMKLQMRLHQGFSSIVQVVWIGAGWRHVPYPEMVVFSGEASNCSLAWPTSRCLSLTTWTWFCPFSTTYLALPGNFFTLNVDKNGYFWTTYPPHLVHVVIDRPPRPTMWPSSPRSAPRWPSSPIGWCTSMPASERNGHTLR